MVTLARTQALRTRLLGAGQARVVAWRTLWTSRLVVFLSGTLAVLAIGRAPRTHGFDPAGLTSPFGFFGNLLASPFARWDSVWYLAIGQGGYPASNKPRTAFFPLYPMLMHAVGIIVGSDLVAGVVISLVCFGIALGLLYQLVALELDDERARATVMLIAFCPMAYFFSAVYSESLYLALSLGCIGCARRGRWAWAGVLGGLGAASRNSGIMLFVPVVLLFLYGPRVDRAAVDHLRAGWRRVLPRYSPSRQLLWALLIPLGLGLYVLYLGLSMHDALAPFRAQQVWYRSFKGPFGGIWTGAEAAWDGIRQILHGPAPPRYFAIAGGNPITDAGQNLMLFAFLVVGVVALIGALRELPIAYGAYCLASLAMPLSYPVTPQPLASLPRYEVVLFPLFMWGSGLVVRRRITTEAIAALACLLGLFTAEFATWRFVA